MPENQPTVEMVPGESSNIDTFGYDAAHAELHVKFRHGRTYVYCGVEPDLYRRFEAAESRGRFLSQHIKGQKHQYKLGEPK